MVLSLQELCRLERDEMLRHKWIESEKAGRDLGQAALIDWALRHDLQFVRERSETRDKDACASECTC